MKIRMTTLTLSEITSAYEAQWDCWPDTRLRYDALGATERRIERFGEFPLIVQCNPARAISTEAKTDARSIAERPCFLCQVNRPHEQQCITQVGDFEVLVNPFPVFPVHFTVVNRNHIRQAGPTPDMIELAAKAPDLAVFFNGAKAGASAPDHLHFQAVLKSELPLLEFVERRHSAGNGLLMCSDDIEPKLPMRFLSAVIPPDHEGMMIARAILGGAGWDLDLINLFVWTGDNGLLRMILLPRTKHRPDNYGDAPGFHISPGALDMIGVMIVPRPDDFNRLTRDDIIDIYNQVSVSADTLHLLRANITTK